MDCHHFSSNKVCDVEIETTLDTGIACSQSCAEDHCDKGTLLVADSSCDIFSTQDYIDTAFFVMTWLISVHR